MYDHIRVFSFLSLIGDGEVWKEQLKYFPPCFVDSAQHALTRFVFIDNLTWMYLYD